MGLEFPDARRTGKREQDKSKKTMSNTATPNGEIRLNNVRLSYPNLFTPKAGQDGGEPKYSAALILDKRSGAAQIESIKKIRDAIADDFWKGKRPAGVKFCLRDGMEKEDVEGYGPDVMFFNASSQRQPVLVHQDPRKPVTKEEAHVLYPGCYVNVVVRFWCQDNKFGKRINAELKAVQFCRSGDPLGGGTPVDPTKAFDTVEDTPAGDSGDAAWD